MWWTRLQHANLRLNFGPLRYLLVTPQSHRIHHSVDPVHYNSNYASVFAWDRLFGTQHKDSASYPPTGIGDRHYPEATSYQPRDLLASLTGQLMYPFSRDRVAVATWPTDGDRRDGVDTPARGSDLAPSVLRRSGFVGRRRPVPGR
ncbi:MAG: sterol desaturase family protein [Acidimicrobiales bacterium]